MQNNLTLRHALEADAADLAALMLSTSLACCFSDSQPCPDWYAASMQPEPISRLIASGDMTWLLACVEDQLAGVLAISEGSHIRYFFVDPAMQRMGIGKRLWAAALQAGALTGPVTVRSSLIAVPVYERLGFKAIEAPRAFNGLRYQAMVASLA